MRRADVLDGEPIGVALGKDDILAVDDFLDIIHFLVDELRSFGIHGIKSDVVVDGVRQGDGLSAAFRERPSDEAEVA